MSKEVIERELTVDEKVEGCMIGLKDLGAIYKSHNKFNLYVEVPKGCQLDNDVLKSKAKDTILYYTGLILRIV